ncbi:MAG: tRNA (N(6)-L-threonylcarbamoyladenosine(37)-C(2))-methylthiotransferase MtaB [Holosporales bacterium]|jgi:threonylcarbamoyladenosine tRNA methylthiotransferase MtaB|nr:tRNA (N(6)-L-threonylcarbamoyladenosine(37)-C(2))-methylthiotransferase MtaB [Holosporales bacterium]
MIEIITFGCRLNIYESEIIRKCANDVRLDDCHGTEVSVFIINSCAVTAEAQRQVRQTIRKYRRGHPNAKIIVTGCAVEVAFEQFAGMPEVNRIINNKDKLDIAAYREIKNDVTLCKHVKIPKRRHASDGKLPVVCSFEGKSRAFVQIQGGCNHFCSYCIIPYARGKSHSFAPEDIVKQIQTLLDAGYPEIVLTGVDIASYGFDLNDKIRLPDLVELILNDCPKLMRLRISSIDPAACNNRLLQLIACEPRILPHIHLSVQSGSDLILEHMRRRHKRADVLNICRTLRSLRGDMSIGADFITGFPGENDDMFQDSYSLIKEADFTFLHVFPYSSRPGTKAAKMVQLPGARQLAKARAKVLRRLGGQQLQKHMSGFIGNQINILIEGKNLAKSDHFMVVIADKSLPEASLAQAKVWKSDNGKLFANII